MIDKIPSRLNLTNKKELFAYLDNVFSQLEQQKEALDTSAIVAITDLKGDITYVNDTFCAISQYSEAELIGQNHRIINSGYHDKSFFLDLWKTIGKGKIWHGDIKNKAKDGSYYWVKTTIVPFLDENNKPYQYVTIRFDITREKNLEDQLKNYKIFFDKSTDLLAVATPEGYFARVNANFAATLGYTEEFLLQTSFFSLIHPDDIASSSKEIEKLELGINTFNFINRYLKKDGTYIHLDWNATFDHNSKQIFCIARDITSRLAIQKEIKDLNENLEEKVSERTQQLTELNKELEAFSYSISHDLRAPLRAINGYSQMLHEDYADKIDEEGNRLLKVIQQNATKMGVLIDDLLHFSRLGRREIQLNNISLNELIEDVLEELLNETHVKYDIKVGHLGKIKGDYALLYQAFYNLLSNSLKYSSKVDNPEISISAENINNRLQVSIQDNGVGFDMEYYDKLFGVFQRLHSAQDFEGTGVGLAIVKRIINKHNGEIWAKSKVNEGAVFTVALNK